MKRSPRFLSSFLLVTSLLLPVRAHADMAKMMCMNRDALLAEKILAANVIVVAAVGAVDSKEGKLKNGGWTFSWNATIFIEKTLQGTLAPKKLTLSGDCSGLPNMSRNHCGVIPAESPKPTVFFLRKGAKGTYRLVSPNHMGMNSCPGAAEIAKANKTFPGLLDKVKKVEEELSKAKAAPKAASPSNKPATNKPATNKPVVKAKGWCAIASSGEPPWTFFGLFGLLGLVAGIRRRRRA